MNDSSPIDLQQYTAWDDMFDSTVRSYVFLLYTSLAVSVSEAAFALIISVWLTRYQRSLTETGPTIHERIRKRHELYTEWRVPVLIEYLPTLAVVALLFLLSSVWDTYPGTSYLLDYIFVIVSLVFRVDGLIRGLHSGCSLPFSPLRNHQAITAPSADSSASVLSVLSSYALARSFGFSLEHRPWMGHGLCIFLCLPSLCANQLKRRRKHKRVQDHTYLA